MYISIPIGPYAMTPLYSDTYKWSINGSPDWANINEIRFQFDGTVDREDIFIDDLHISGKVVRHAYDTSEVTATQKERMLLCRLDTALDDTLETTNNTGTTALLAASELYKSTTVPTVGTIETPLKEDLLPGQTLQIYAGLKRDGSTYRWSNQAMRAKEVSHIIDVKGYRTKIELTSDVTNSNASGVPNAWGILMDNAGALGHGQAKDLKASGIDNLISRLAWDPT